ncbi:MAG: hypothetical protein CRN43_07100 [Candidatus Nephrothrix sp. EaCA]|nr:MAG: hypothetical protein CRN43_07100 [Candidatus Nephrothrix sp. EaCA]
MLSLNFTKKINKLTLQTAPHKMDIKTITDNYLEAVRYMENAKDMLKNKACKVNGVYQDKKYVRMACAIAYLAALLATETYLACKGKPIPNRKDRRNNIDDYKRELAKADRKMLSHLHGVWNSLHCDGYYEGVATAKGIQIGMECAECLINAIRPAGEEALVTKI